MRRGREPLAPQDPVIPTRDAAPSPKLSPGPSRHMLVRVQGLCTPAVLNMAASGHR